MTAPKISSPPPAGPRPAPDSLASTLQTVATAVKAVHTDEFRDPGEIAADDVGASRIATELNRSQEAKRA